MATLAETLEVPDDNLLDRDFYQVLESHLQYLIKYPETLVLTVSDLFADVYTGDFYGLLNYLNIDKKFHYIVLRCNGLYASGDFDGKSPLVVFPPPKEMNAIFNLYNSREYT